MATHPAAAPPDETGRLTTREVLEAISGLLDRIDHDRSSVSASERLALADLGRGAAGRLEALVCALVAEVDAANASMKATGTPSSSWLALSGNLSRKESAGLLYKARAVSGREQVRDAALAGRIGIGQARAIATVLNELPAGLSEDQVDRAEALLVGMADQLDAVGLAKSAGRVLAEVAPDQEAEASARRLQRQAEAARRKRSLWFVRDGGSVAFKGSLPTADAEGWMAIIDSYTESKRRNAVEERDPLAPRLTPEQRRADALVAMVAAHQQQRLAPSVGGDRPRVVVTVDYDRLRGRAAEAGVVRDGEEISAGELRRLCCDADLLPAVLGGPSEVLDVGQERRLVTRGIRGALTLRDAGCVFPACDTHATACEAHHIVPWWAGGATALSNLVLLCHHHHGLVEPDQYGQRDQWRVRIGADGVPEVIPPARYDPERRPLRHQRFRRQDVPAGEVRAGDVEPAREDRAGEDRAGEDRAGEVRAGGVGAAVVVGPGGVAPGDASAPGGPDSGWSLGSEPHASRAGADPPSARGVP